MNENLPDTTLRGTVGESFNIFQSTVAMLSIFMGFVFAALLQLLGNAAPLTMSQHVTAWFLVVAMLMLLSALICFHTTAHQVIRYWKIFLPRSTARTLGAVLFPLGIASMLLATSTMLWSKELRVLGTLPVIASAALLANLLWSFRRLHSSAPYVRDVSGTSQKAEPSSSRPCVSHAREAPNEEAADKASVGARVESADPL